MIKSLLIRHYALIDELSVDFPAGLVIITGETGAGKSIVIDALGMILGERASQEVIRSGADRSVVEAVFIIAGNRRLEAFLHNNDIAAADELIVRREISVKGQSRCFVNDSPVTLTLLKQIGQLLVDLHGQHEHQSLLRTETHIDLLDEFGGLDGMLRDYREAYERLRSLAGELDELRIREQQLREKREFHEFQMREIDAVAPADGEEEQLQNELNILENAEKLFEATGRLYQMLYEGDQAINDQLVLVRNQLHDLAAIDRQFQEAAGESSAAVAIVGELAKFVQRYNAGIEFTPERLEEIRLRLGRIALLKKKYGGSIERILEFRKAIGGDVELAENFETVIARLTEQVGQMREACVRAAERLSAKRKETARKVDRAIVTELAKLGIPNARFSTRIARQVCTGDAQDQMYAASGTTRHRLTPAGLDEVEFFVSTNIGEEEKPLARTASGGEVSRIMLALKSILAKSDRLPVLVFDEVDVGVSGRIAQAVGRSLKTLSQFHQVIAITHLPQIAGMADAHFTVFKTDDGARTRTAMRALTQDERVREVAKLMSGAEVTAVGLEGARELMGIK